MKSLISALIIFLSISAETKAELTCNHLFTKEYLVFVYREQSPVNPIRKTIDFGLGNSMTGDVITSICGEVDIPEGCGELGKAKLVFQTGPGSCPVIIPPISNWEYTLDTFETREQTVSMRFNSDDINMDSLRFLVVCVP